MAKVSIRVHSVVEEYGVMLKGSLQLTAEATEGFVATYMVTQILWTNNITR